MSLYKQCCFLLKKGTEIGRKILLITYYTITISDYYLLLFVLNTESTHSLTDHQILGTSKRIAVKLDTCVVHGLLLQALHDH